MAHLKLDKPAGRIRNRPLKDYAGARFGRLVALSLIERDLAENNHLWLFRCDCGTEKAARIKNVRSGNTTSCGCAFSEMVAARNATHGLSRHHSREYRTWKDMRARCSNPNDSDFASYGGRGIRVCERWGDFAAFYADMGDRPTGATLDRIDVNGHYEPGNCRWATATEQANNKRGNRWITMNGETRTLQQWCDAYGIDHSKAGYRLRRGWPLERVFSKDDYRR